MKKFGFFLLVIIFTLSLSNSQTWSPPIRLTWNSGISDYPCIAAVLGGGIHVVWEDDTPGNIEIFYKRGSFGGASWFALKRLTWSTYESKNPSIAVDSTNKIHVVWHDKISANLEIVYKSSTNGGGTWSGMTRLTWSVGQSREPSIAVDSSNRIHVVWRDDSPGEYDIFYKRSTDGGTSWSAPKRLSWNAGGSYNPSIATSGNRVHVVWWDVSPGDSEIFYKRSTDGGITWSGFTRLTWMALNSIGPSIATDSGNGVHVVWFDSSPGSFEILYKNSIDGGSSWSGRKRLTWSVGGSFNPAIALDSGNDIHVVWEADTAGFRQIYYKNSTDSGNTWSGPTRLTWTANHSYDPSIATSGTQVQVVWCDKGSGNNEIYFKIRN